MVGVDLVVGLETSRPNQPNPTYLIKKNEYLKKKNEYLNKINEFKSSRLQSLLSSSNMLYANMTLKIFVTNICNKDIKKFDADFESLEKTSRKLTRRK
jgi:hypothetical protein